MSTRRVNQSMAVLAGTTAALTTAFTLGSTIKKLCGATSADVITQNASFLKQNFDY